MTVRAKMKCFSVEHLKDGKPDTTLADIRFCAIYDDDDPTNKAWSKYTPSADFRMMVTNPGAIEQFTPGKSYYVDFTPVDQA